MSYTGSCSCGKIKITINGEPAKQGLCHCGACQKLSGSVFTTNLIVPAEIFTFEGSPTAYDRVGDSGKTITNYFCSTCGTSLWGEGGFDGAKVVRAGVLDGEGVIDGFKPQVEVYSEKRVGWLKAVEGIPSLIGMSGVTASSEE